MIQKRNVERESQTRKETKTENSQTRKKEKKRKKEKQKQRNRELTNLYCQCSAFFFLPATCGGGAMVEETKREKHIERESDVKCFWV